MTSFLSAELYQVEIVQFSFGKLGNFDGAKMTYIYLQSPLVVTNSVVTNYRDITNWGSGPNRFSTILY